MKNRLILTTVISALAFTGAASAQVSGSGSLGVTADVQGSILLTFVSDGSGMTVTGSATSTASLPMGTVKMFGASLPSGLTLTPSGVSSFALSTPFDVRVDLANTTSSTYTLTAILSSADSTNTWTLGGMNISDGTLKTLTITGAYATAVPYTLSISIPASEAAFSLSNTINFVASAN
ncbi:MAG TPA: hypothetical protein VKG25_01440 [Bryobacteraceae bacterium]|nr:hypothetical protein [Bryobacteraceae bacterium]